MNATVTRPVTSTRLSIAPDTALLCAMLLVAPELFGGVFPWTVIVIAALSLASLGTAIWVRRAESRPVVDGVFIVMVAAWLWTCLQAVPLPLGLADAMHLGSVQSAERLQDLAWVDSVPLTVSYDPGSTYLQILTGICVLSAFLAARLGGASGLKPIAIATVVSSVLLGLVGITHELTGSEVLFGIYSPRFTVTRLLAPLMNTNHLGGFSLLGALVAAGLAAQTREVQSRIPWIAASIFCTIVVACTLSRGAIGATLCGFVLLGVWLVGSKRPDGHGAAIPLAVVAATLAGVVAFAGLQPILSRFEQRDFSKLEVALHGFRLLDGSTWWLGVGRGAFSSAFVAYEGSKDRITHPENLVVQWITEWGAPIGLTLLLVLTLALWKRLRSAREPLVAGVCIAIFALTLQNLVDFSLELAGVATVVAALLGAVLPASRHGSARGSWALSLVTMGVLSAALLTLAPTALRSDTQSIVDQLTSEMQAGRDTRVESILRRGLALHPNEPALALLAGTYAGSKRHPDTARWLSIAMDQAPGWGVPHVAAARWLFLMGRTDQALLEIREAENRQPTRGQKVLCEILQRFPQIEYVERAAPNESRRVAYLNQTMRCHGLPDDLRADVDETILKYEPSHADAVWRKARRLAARERWSEAIALLQEATKRNPDDDRLWLALIGAHLSNGNAEQARRELEAASSTGSSTRTFLEGQARIEAALSEADAMRATLTRLRGQARGDPQLVARSFVLEGELEASLGNVDEALTAYRTAYEVNQASGALERAAALAAKSGRPALARQFYRTLCRRTPDGAACAREAHLSKDASSSTPAQAVP